MRDTVATVLSSVHWIHDEYDTLTTGANNIVVQWVGKSDILWTKYNERNQSI